MALNDPQLRIRLGTDDPFTSQDVAFIGTQTASLKFSRNFTDAQRALFDTATTSIGQYVNFTSMTKDEYASWVDTYGEAQIQGYLATDSTGDFYEQVNNGTEYLCDFSNTDWLDFRLTTIPGWEAVGKLGSTNLEYLSLDLCPLFPTKFLVGGQGNPYADVDTWKTNMLAAVAYVRARIDSGIELIVNGLRQFVFEDPRFVDNPAAFEDYDGVDLVNPGTYADAVGIEIGFDYAPTTNSINEWLYTLRAIYRCASASKLAGCGFKSDFRTEPQSAAEIQRRVNNIVSYALVHDANYTVFSTGAEGEFTPYPTVAFPESALDFGTPVEAVDANFTGYAAPDYKLLTRTFSTGYAVLFNFTAAEVAVPATYRSGYEQIRPNGYFTFQNGATQGALVTAAVPDTLQPGEGLLLTAQGNTLTVTTDALENLTGACTVYFGVGETGMMIDSGEFTVGDERAEADILADLVAGDFWQVALSAGDTPGDRDDRLDLEYKDVVDASRIGSTGQGRWVRVILRSLAPDEHILGSAELDFRHDSDGQ